MKNNHHIILTIMSNLITRLIIGLIERNNINKYINSVFKKKFVKCKLNMMPNIADRKTLY